MASRPCATTSATFDSTSSSSSCGRVIVPTPRANTRTTDQMISVIELEDSLRQPHLHDVKVVQEATSRLVAKIKAHLADFKPVLIRGWRRDLQQDFSAESLQLTFGDMGQRVQYFDCFAFARNRDLPKKQWKPQAQSTTLKRFVEDIDNADSCGNWLDSKHLQPNPPFFINPLLDDLAAWNHTVDIRFCQKQKQGYTFLQNDDSTARAIRLANWTSPGWRLVSHSGAFHPAHHDCCGFATYVVAEHGCKVWAIMMPKSGVENSAELMKAYISMCDPIEGQGYDCDMVVAFLEKNDVLYVLSFLTD